MSQIDQLQQKISFFESSNEAMEKIAKSENDRLQLEIQLNKLINSDESIAKAKAVKLKAYYQKLCDDEEKSLKRNQQLLVDLQRIDSQFLQLDSKLERLNNLKKECEVYLRTAYPAWTSDKKIFNSNEQKQNLKTDFMNQIKNIPKYEEKDSIINALVSSIKTDKPESPVKEQKSVIGDLVMNLTKTQLADTVVHKTVDKKDQDDFGIKQLSSGFRPLTSTVKFDEDLQRTTTTMNQDNNLLKEYEKQLKRQDTNMIDTLNQTGTSVINFEDNVETMNIPLNKMGTWSSPYGDNEIPKASTGKDGSLKKSNLKEDPNEINRQGSIRQEISLNTFYYLVDYIELEIQHTIHPERYYRQEEPHYKTKLEILRIAHDKESLDEIDPADISMVILEQLPHVVRKQTKNKCIFTADLMSLSVADVSEQMVSLFLKEDIDIKLWTRLVKHMSFLKRYAAMDSLAIARKFAPSFLAFDSIAVEKAIKFLEKILNDSSKPNDDKNKTVILDESLSKTETSLNQELAAASNSNLKESSAYQDFINSGQSRKYTNVQVLDDSDENDEINNLVTPKPMASANSTGNSNENYSPTKSSNFLIKSPRKDYDFDFSQSSKTESKLQPSIKNSLRSSKDKKQIPVYLKDDSDDESDLFSEMSSKFKNKPKDSDSDFDFYK